MVPLAHFDGENVDKKLETLVRCAGNEFFALAKEKGSVVCLRAGMAAVVPGSMAYSVISSKGGEDSSGDAGVAGGWTLGVKYPLFNDKNRNSDSIAFLEQYALLHDNQVVNSVRNSLQAMIE